MGKRKEYIEKNIIMKERIIMKKFISITLCAVILLCVMLSSCAGESKLTREEVLEYLTTYSKEIYDEDGQLMSTMTYNLSNTTDEDLNELIEEIQKVGIEKFEEKVQEMLDEGYTY